MRFDPTAHYPLGQKRPDLVSTPGGHGLDEITLDAVRAGRIGAADLPATPGTLRLQADIALAADRRPLAANLARAAAPARLPAEAIREVYPAPRPGRPSA